MRDENIFATETSFSEFSFVGSKILKAAVFFLFPSRTKLVVDAVLVTVDRTVFP